MHVRESGPLIHAQDAARARAPHGPYLDRIATTQHLPHADDSAWRRARIQPVLKPSLVHTGLMPEFFHGASPETFMNPDGSVSDSLRTTIHARVRRLPRAASLDPRNMRNVDADRLLRRSYLTTPLDYKGASALLNAGGGGGGGASVAGEDSVQTLPDAGARARASAAARAPPPIEDEFSVTDSSLASSLARKPRGREKNLAAATRRLKTPYSTQSLFDCLLDLQYGETGKAHAPGGDGSCGWNVKEVIDAIEAS